MRTYNYTDVSISNRQLSEQFQAELSKNEVCASIMRHESQTVSFFMRQNQLQKMELSEEKSSLLDTPIDSEDKGLSRDQYELLVSLLVNRIRKTKEPFGQCHIELNYISKNNSFIEVNTCTKVEKHFKRS